MEHRNLSDFTTLWDRNAYNESQAQLKDAFHRHAAKQLRILAKRLGLASGTFEVRSNKAGIAVSGEITLHGEQIYVQVGASSSGLGILVRTCDGRRDYCGHTNQWFPLSALDEGERFAKTLQQIINARFGEKLEHPMASRPAPMLRFDLAAFVDWTPHPRGAQFYRVAGVGHRGGEIGECVGIMGLKHASGYEAVLRFPDGALESFGSHALFPAQREEQREPVQTSEREPHTLELPL